MFRSPDASSTQWYKDALIYEVHVRAFADSNDDGIGDFPGLTARLDYLSQLGVDTIWLLPFYPSPLRDDGYDIAGYYDVHPSYGTLDDFRTFLDAAHVRGMRVITELVINHTSDQHPWFQRARRARPGTTERDFYVWSNDPDRYGDVRIIFKDTEASNWAWDSVAGAYYWHRFFTHQPDLNYDNPDVQEAVTDVLRFWLDMGVDGLRLDAIPYLFEREGTNGENLPETHDELKRLRAFMDEHYDDRMLLAEANQWPEDAAAYFGDGDECHMSFHFPLMPRLYLALQRENRLPIIDILEQTPDIPDDAQWAIFLRNHDELTLEMVSEEERELLWRTYAPDRRMRLNLGIRRRLAPLLENDRRRIELLFSLLLSLPGTPVIYYGDEIGMGDNVFLQDRDGVRTPMQWSNDRNAGFSRANPQSLYLPVVVDPVYHYETVNVEVQQANPNSLLAWVRDMIRRRQRHPVFGRGAIEFLHPDNEHVLAFLREGEGESVLVVANLSRHSQHVVLDLASHSGSKPTEMVGRTAFPEIGEEPYGVSLGPYGFYWFELDDHHGLKTTPAGVVEFDGRLESLAGDDGAFAMAAASYIARQSWYRDAPPRRGRVAIEDVLVISAADADPALGLAVVSMRRSARDEDRYLLPIGLSSDVSAAEEAEVIARVAADGHEGVVFDALASPAFSGILLAAVRSGETVVGHSGYLSCSVPDADAAIPAGRSAASATITYTTGETYLEYGDDLIIKLFRKLEPGVNPDPELRRFLTDRTAFDQLAAAYGSLDYTAGDTVSLGVLQEAVPESQSAWMVFHGLFQEWQQASGPALQDRSGGAFLWSNGGSAGSEGGALEVAENRSRDLARMTAALHQALGSLSEDPDIQPEPFSQLYQQSLYQSLRASVRQEVRAIRRLADRAGALAPEVKEAMAAEDVMLSWIDPIRRVDFDGVRIRVHGDYRLDEVYLVDDRFIVEDLSGDHNLPLDERRLRASPLRDVAQMIRSFDYAALTVAIGGSDEEREAAERWAHHIASEFMLAYLEAMDGSPLIPDVEAHIAALVDAYMTVRALRELRWDLAVRPDWAAVSLAAIRRRLGWSPSFIRAEGPPRSAVPTAVRHRFGP